MIKNKKLYGTTFFEKIDLIENNLNHLIEIEYYKVKTIKDKFQIAEEKISYGIEVIKKEYKNKKIKAEKTLIENITNNEQKANSILEVLKRNKVTPISFKDVVFDIIKMEF